MGIQINGNNDTISALDGSWTAEGASINTSGILTATTFKGNIVGTAATFTGPVTIGGTLTYEDVTNIDSVGIITARGGIDCNGDLDVDGHTNLDNVSIAGVSTFTENVSIVKTAGPLLELTTNTGAADATLRLSEGATGSTTNGGGMVYSGADNKLHITCGANSTTKRITINRDDGKIGIGSEIPTAKFEIHNGSNIEVLRIKDTHFNKYLTIRGGGSPNRMVVDSYEGGGGGADIDFASNGSTKVRIASTGKVLIGDGASYNANGLLHLVGDDNSNGPELYLQVGNNNTTDNIGALWYGNNVDKSLVKLAGHTHTANNTSDFTVSTSSGGTLTEKLRITSDGVVNIGDVTTNTWIDSTLKVRKDQNAVTKIAVRNENQGSSASSAIVVNAYGNSWMFDCGSAAKNSNALTIRVDATASSNQGTEKLRINSSGAVSIASNNYGSGHSSAKLRVGTESGGTQGTVVFGSGDTTTPALTLTNWDGSQASNWSVIQFDNSGRGNFQIGGTAGADAFSIYDDTVERLRIDSSGRVLIGGGSSPTQVGDAQLLVYSSDRLHPAIKCAGKSNNYANGWTLLGDNYQADESQVNLGVSYSSSSLVLSRCCKVSGSADNTYLSSQDSYNAKPSALVLDNEGALRFHTTETSATRTTDSAVSLVEVFNIDRVGNIRQKITGRYMYFGASQALKIGVNGSDPLIDAVSGDLSIKNTDSTIAVVRSDHLQMYADIKMNNDKGISFINADDTATGETVSNSVLNDYEEGTWTPGLSFNGGTSGLGISNAAGYYIKIGRLVQVGGTIILNARGSSTGAAALTNLPYVVGNNDAVTSAEGGGILTYWASMGNNRPGYILRGSHNSSTADIAYNRADGYSTLDGATHSEFTNSSSIRFIMTYQT